MMKPNFILFDLLHSNGYSADENVNVQTVLQIDLLIVLTLFTCLQPAFIQNF